MLRPFLVALTLALPAQAETPTPVKTAELSARLYAAGIEMADPILILSAAKLRKSLAPTPTDRAAQDGASAADSPLTWEDMLAEAEALAGDDEALVGLISDVRAESTKGVSSGPVYNIGAIANGKTDTYPLVDFVGGEYAEVYVEAKSATDLNLTVTDAQGRLVCADTDSSRIAYCGWRPADTAGFVLKVQNNGPSSANYALMTN